MRFEFKILTIGILLNSSYLLTMEDTEYLAAELAAQGSYSTRTTPDSDRVTPVSPIHQGRPVQLALSAVMEASRNLTPIKTKGKRLKLQIADQEKTPDTVPQLELKRINDMGKPTGEMAIIANPVANCDKISNIIEFIMQNFEQNLISQKIDTEHAFSVTITPDNGKNTNPYSAPNRIRMEGKLLIKRDLAKALLRSSMLEQLLEVDHDADMRIKAAIID